MGFRGQLGRNDRTELSGPKRRVLARTAGLFRPFQHMVLGLVLLIIVTASLDLAPALIVKEMVDAANEGRARERLDWLFGLLIVTVLASGLLGVLLGYVNQMVGQGVMFRLRGDLHAHLTRLPVRFFTQTRTGEILSRVSTDVNGVQGAVTGTFTEFLQNAITLAVALGLMVVLEWRLALFAAVILPLWVYPTMRVGMIQRRLMREWHEENAQMAAHLEETLSVSGVMLVKTFGRQTHESTRFEASNQRLRQLAIRRLMAGRWFNLATGLLGRWRRAPSTGSGAARSSATTCRSARSWRSPCSRSGCSSRLRASRGSTRRSSPRSPCSSASSSTSTCPWRWTSDRTRTV
jgi:ATP-binding cassette subfamily B protein